MIKTWQQRCEEHPDHQQGIVTQQMIQDRMQEEIDEIRQALAQSEQEAFYRLIRIMGTFDLASGHANTMDELLDSLESELRDVLGFYRARREWVELTDEEIEATDGVEMKYIGTGEYVIDGEYEFARAIEAKLKEKNT